MIFTAEMLVSALMALGCAGGVYAAIRADLATLHERATHAQISAHEAHQRIDRILKA